MTVITYEIEYSESVGLQAELSVCGHAGYDASGRDIVCAAISMTVETLEAALKREPGVDVRCEKGPGRFWLRCCAGGRGEGLPQARSAAMVEMAVLGLEMLAEEYPGNVCCRRREGRDRPQG